MPNPCKQSTAANGGLSGWIQDVHGISPPVRTETFESPEPCSPLAHGFAGGTASVATVANAADQLNDMSKQASVAALALFKNLLILVLATITLIFAHYYGQSIIRK